VYTAITFGGPLSTMLFTIQERGVQCAQTSKVLGMDSSRSFTIICMNRKYRILTSSILGEGAYCHLSSCKQKNPFIITFGSGITLSCTILGTGIQGKIVIYHPRNWGYNCFASSPWRPHTEDKRMVLEHTHGLFIT
jgi:hypothetical protein